MQPNIIELERRYQQLFKDYQTGTLDETTFIAEIDKLQFQDNWGRFWMIGSQTGAWHYYDGQNWHQADPNDADKLPFMDNQGRYWQKGAKSGDWYYYQADTNQWVKPGQGDPTGPSLGQAGTSQSAFASQTQPRVSAPAAPAYSAPAPQPQANYTAAPAPVADPLDNQLFQDDDGRYWSVGAKSGQWYFYDESGWHPAEEFEARHGRSAYAPPAPTYQPIYQPTPIDSRPYAPQPQPYSGPMPGQSYTAAPPQPAYAPSMPSFQAQPPLGQTILEQPASYTTSPAAAPARATSTPPPGNDPQSPPPGQSGSWFYFDGKQWIQYATGEPAVDAPPSAAGPDDKVISAESAAVAGPAASPRKNQKSDAVVAEYIEEDEPPIEVVDVEVITVVEAEPETGTAPAVSAYAPPAPQPHRERTIAAPTVPVSRVAPAAASTAASVTAASPIKNDEVVPRRTKSGEMPAVDRRAAATTVAAAPKVEAPAIPRRRPATPTETGPMTPTTTPGSASPRKRPLAAQEPTIIIPTGAATTPPASARTTGPSSPTAPIPVQNRRAREATLPMEPISQAPAVRPRPASTPVAPITPSNRHREVTQPLPAVTLPADAAPLPATPPTSEPAAPMAAVIAAPVVERTPQPPAPPVTAKEAAPTPASKPVSTPVPPVKPTQPEKEGFTLGDMLRAFPSTLWTGLAGVAILFIFAIIIIGAFMYGSTMFGGSSQAAVQTATPTLDAELPAATPTPGPTPSAAPTGPVSTPTPVDSVVFSSKALEITLEYPENWYTKEKENSVLLSPSEEALQSDDFTAPLMSIGQATEKDVTISNLLSTVLAQFPKDAETLNSGTISIASQVWTSTQIRFNDENLGGQGIATIAVTNKDNQGYYLVALAPAQEWNATQPTFQGMINSFRFGAETVVAVAKASETPKAGPTKAATADKDATPEKEGTAKATAEKTPTPSPSPSPTPQAAATPLVYAIQSGDSLLEIANKFGVDVDLLTEENGITDPSGLQIGQELTIPFTAEQLAEYNAKNGVTTVASANKATVAATTPAAEAADSTPTAKTTPADTAEAPAEAEPTKEAASAAPVSGRIVYPAYVNNMYDVWMVDLGSMEQTPIAGTASQPAFNKDGSLLAYRSWDKGTRGIFFRDFIGGRGGIVTRFVEDGLPSWTPDGSFAFSSRKEGDRVPRIYLGNQQGDEPYAVGFQGEYVSVMPNGQLIAKGCTPSGDCGLYLMGPRGGGEKKISSETSDTAPAPSPDGTKLALMSFNRGGNNWEIWVMNVDGTNPVRLTEDSSADGLPAWSPDGQSIAFVSNRGGVWAVWVMNADGSNPRKLFDMKGPPDGKILYDESNSRGWLEERISWAP